MNVFEKLMKVQEELKAPKSQFNSFGKYSYRSCEDILESVKPLLIKNKAAITITDEVVNIGDRFYIKATATFIDVEVEKDRQISTNAYAREPDVKKGMDPSQITGSTSSYARKYALNGLLAIDDNKDADTTNTHGKTNQQNSNKLSENQIKRLFAIANKSGYSTAEVKMASMSRFKKNHLEDLAKSEYDTMCSGYEKNPKKGK